MSEDFSARPLGRFTPTDWRHVERFPFAAVAPRTIGHVEHMLTLPGWHPSHDQGREGSCVGHAIAMERAITNEAQAKAAHLPIFRRYDPVLLWRSAKAIDEWPETKPDDDNGTSVRAGYEVARTQGLARVRSMHLDANELPQPTGEQPADAAEGVQVYRWATTVDEVRTAIGTGTPVAIGVEWLRGFDTPKLVAGEHWLPAPAQAGSSRGGHAVCLYGASDRRQAFRLKNNWGRGYPLVWMPYATLTVLLERDGEAALVTDR